MLYTTVDQEWGKEVKFTDAGKQKIIDYFKQSPIKHKLTNKIIARDLFPELNLYSPTLPRNPDTSSDVENAIKIVLGEARIKESR